MNRNQELEYEVHWKKITSKTVIDFLDNFSNNLVKKTVAVMDRASIHTSELFYQKLAEWQQKKSGIFWLPTDLPKLNLIEILWKFVKYEWIEVEAYENWKALTNYLKKVLDNLGSKYVINFV